MHSSQSSRRVDGTRLLLLLIALGPVCACGGGDRPEVVPVTGRVTKGGEPFGNVLIHFFPQKGRSSTGQTDAEGNYELFFSKKIPKGAVPGKHKVYFAVAQQSIDEKIDLSDAKYHPDLKDVLKKCGRYDTTPIIVEVAHDQESLDIEIDDFLEEE